MTFRARRVISLRCPVTQRMHPVLLCSDYGVVVPTLWTTNGSNAYAAELVSSWVRVGSLDVVRSSLGKLDFSNELALRQALAELYREWARKLRPS